VFIVPFFAKTSEHLNHANLGWDYRFLKYIFKYSKMHIWHHHKQIPIKFEANFGISVNV